jgi:hypothetical protein
MWERNACSIRFPWATEHDVYEGRHIIKFNNSDANSTIISKSITAAHHIRIMLIATCNLFEHCSTVPVARKIHLISALCEFVDAFQR